jgi:hypothetical protein
MLISDARELARVPPRRTMVPSPGAFSGTLGQLWDRFIESNLPTAGAVARFHHELASYVQGRDALLLVRQVRGMERREEYATEDGTRLKATDNAPAWWVHYALLQDCEVAPGAFARVIETMPAHLFDVSRTMPASANSAGWHIAHLFGVKDGTTNFRTWRGPDAVARFVRNIHPCNYGLLPKPEWQRWGGNERVIAFFVERFAARYADVWDDFVSMSRVDRGTIARVAGAVHYSYDSAATSPTMPSPVVDSSRAPSASGGGVTRASYRATRLLFKRDVIEPLADDDVFEVVTPHGLYAMTKADFGRVFPNVRQSLSYRERGVYHYATVPKSALAFLVASSANAEEP